MSKSDKQRFIWQSVVIISAILLISLIIHGRGGTLTVASYQSVRSIDPPVVDYDTEIVTEKSKARKEKDSHFKGLGNPDNRKPIAELPQGVEPLPTNSHWWIGLSALPVEQSDIVVLGNIVGREAHLSDDRTGVYSEFIVQIDQIFKDTTGALLIGGSLPVNRLGGSVRFASGKIQKYALVRQGMPCTGAQYVLFLRKTAAGDLLILTGYELTGERVNPLDGEDTSDPRSNLPFAKYRDAERTTFLKELRESTAKLVTESAK